MNDLRHAQNIRGHHAHDDGGGGAGALDGHGEEDSEHNADYRVLEQLGLGEDSPGVAAAQESEGGGQEVQGTDEHVQEAQHNQQLANDLKFNDA